MATWHQGTVAVSNLNLRTAPTTNAQTLTKLKKGTTVYYQSDCSTADGLSQHWCSSSASHAPTATAPSPYVDAQARIWWRLKRGGWAAARVGTTDYMQPLLSQPEPLPDQPGGAGDPTPDKDKPGSTLSLTTGEEDKTGTAVAILGISIILVGALTFYLVKKK